MVKNLPANTGDTGSISELGRSPVEGRRSPVEPTPVCLPGKSHGQGSLAADSPHSHKRVGHQLETKTANKTLSTGCS